MCEITAHSWKGKCDMLGEKVTRRCEIVRIISTLSNLCRSVKSNAFFSLVNSVEHMIVFIFQGFLDARSLSLSTTIVLAHLH